jgi:hypothetical protein
MNTQKHKRVLSGNLKGRLTHAYCNCGNCNIITNPGTLNNSYKWSCEDEKWILVNDNLLKKELKYLFKQIRKVIRKKK